MKNELQKAVDIVLFRRETIASVASNSNANLWGLVVVLVPILGNAFLFSWSIPSGFSSLFSRFLFLPVLIPYLSLALAVFLVGLFVQHHYKAQADLLGFYRVMIYSAILLWLTMLPALFSLIGLGFLANFADMFSAGAEIWYFVVLFEVLRVYFHLSDKRAGLALVLAIFLFFVLQPLFRSVLLG
jgi:hypothetical protein